MASSQREALSESVQRLIGRLPYQTGPGPRHTTSHLCLAGSLSEPAGSTVIKKWKPHPSRGCSCTGPLPTPSQPLLVLVGLDVAKGTSSMAKGFQALPSLAFSPSHTNFSETTDFPTCTTLSALSKPPSAPSNTEPCNSIQEQVLGSPEFRRTHWNLENLSISRESRNQDQESKFVSYPMHMTSMGSYDIHGSNS